MNIDDRIRAMESPFLVGDLVKFDYNRDHNNPIFERYDGMESAISAVRGGESNNYLYFMDIPEGYDDDYEEDPWADRDEDDDDDEDERVRRVTIYTKKESLTMIRKRECIDENAKPDSMGFEF